MDSPLPVPCGTPETTGLRSPGQGPVVVLAEPGFDSRDDLCCFLQGAGLDDPEAILLETQDYTEVLTPGELRQSAPGSPVPGSPVPVSFDDEDGLAVLGEQLTPFSGDAIPSDAGDQVCDLLTLHAYNAVRSDNQEVAASGFAFARGNP